MSPRQSLINAVLEGDQATVKLEVMEAVSRGEKANEIMNEGLIAAMDIVGAKMEAEELYIPEVLLSAKAMAAGVAILRPHLSGDAGKHRGSVVIGSVFGDIHDIGKNLVKMLLESAGFLVTDLGINVESEKFLAAVRENKANIVCMSALLTTTMPGMKDVITKLEENSLRDQVKIIIGGAPVSEVYAKKIGADAYGADAGAAVRIAKSFSEK
jgi:5-methyltetrahydrofolate--homocysteine methyltransferase